MTKRAIIHVENTDGILDFARFLVDSGWTILTANKTEELLRREKIPYQRETALQENNFFVNDTSGFIQSIISTKYPDSDIAQYREQSDDKDVYLICVNLYPMMTSNYTDNNNKINLPPYNFYMSTILRTATINYRNILIICDPEDYKEAIIQLRTDNITEDFRLYLAAKALNMVSAYDSGLADSLLFKSSENTDFLNYLTFPYTKLHQLKGGSNPQQKACLYKSPVETGAMTGLQRLPLKEMDYNIITDASLAWDEICMLYTNLKNQYTIKTTNCDGYSFVTQFTPLTGTVFTIAIKYKSIIGAALSTNVVKAFKNTYTYDISSIKDVTIGCSSVVDEAAAKEMVNCNIAAIIAPGFTPRAKETLSTNKGIRLIPTSKIANSEYDLELLNGGLLFQKKDSVIFNQWQIKTKNRPTQYMADQMIFGMLLAMASRTYSAVVLKNNYITGISQASKSDTKAVSNVLVETMEYQTRNGIPETESLGELLVCDTALSLCPAVKKLIDNGVTAILQTGGSESDNEFIQYCDEHNVVMVFTGMTHITY